MGNIENGGKFAVAQYGGGGYARERLEEPAQRFDYGLLITQDVADQHANALVVADLAARAILAAQANAPPGAIGIHVEEDFDLWAVVHQAAGMISVQLDCRR